MSSFRNRFRAWLTGKTWILPWVSLTWGLISGILIARDFAHGWKVLVFSIALMVFSILLSLWFVWKESVEELGLELRGLAARVHARSTWVEWAGITATQMTLQYIFMFSVTFLFFAKAWIILAATLGFGATVMWDPWFQRLAKVGWYENAVRALGALLAASFILSVFLPWCMPYYGWILGLVGGVAALPWRRLWWMRVRGLRIWALFLSWDFVPFACVAVAVAVSGNRGRVLPPLSVWIRGGGLGEGVAERELVSPFVSPLTQARFTDAQLGQGVCCRTPLVAPRTLRMGVVHEWRVDGRVVERIPLGEATGLDGEMAYRTYSCKRSFPGVVRGARVECATLLASGQEVGSVTLEIEK